MSAQVAIPDAVNRIADDFRDAAPGHRFLLYLPMWQPGWALDKAAKGRAAKACTSMPMPIQKLRDALRQRQAALAAVQQAWTVQAISTAPFATGLGNEHPIENGFAFLSPYGLPYLAGSGVKGVLRRAMQELRDDGLARFTDEVIDALFGCEDVENARRGVLDVWDCFPDGALTVEIMTPHQGGYYQNGDTPHDAGQPVPVPFLAVAAGGRFDFHVVCHEARWPEALRGTDWRALLEQAFAHAFAWLGFGAKTAVGYGAMTENPEARRQREAQAAAAQARAAAEVEAARRAAMSPQDQEWEINQPALKKFGAAFEQARKAAYNPSGTFNAERLDFMKQALTWIEARSRSAAAELLAQTATKHWGRPSKKERWQELQDAIKGLGGAA